ncbi:MAG: hypothetical protein LBE13_07860 [Bacteroidales bacterium]|jgi:RHS repeat-associated protein|nr:hypothetical protein [Bacteroidales bacterium]
MVKRQDNNYFESTNFGGGRINKTNNAYDINYFITDHLGSTRVILDNAGNIKAQYNYYPFGKQWEDPNLMANTNRYTFSGKEKQTVRDLGFLDFGARMLETEIGRWFVIDPLAEKYYSVSPYVYCSNNPIGRTDPNGMLDDWVRNYETDEYEWMDNVTSPENTPDGYGYVGANDDDILTDMGVTTNISEQYKQATGFGFDGDENIPLGAAPILPTNHVNGNIGISAIVSYNIDNSTENNRAGKKFEGIIVSGVLIQPDRPYHESGNLFVSYGDKQYSDYFRKPSPEKSMFIQAGTIVKIATVYIPATEISSSKVLSSASIRSAHASNALLRQIPYTEFNWYLQSGTSFRQGK